MSAERFGNHIGGRSVDAADAVFELVNPARRDEVLGEFPRSGAAEVDAAVAAARAALPAWRSTPWPARGEIILRAGLLLEERKEEMARLMTREMGKVLLEARGDVQEGVDMAKYIAGEARRPYGETVPSELRDKWAMTMRQPLGVVGDHHPLELPGRHPHLEALPRAARRQHRRLQAGGGHPALRPSPRRDPRGGRDFLPESSTSSSASGPRRARRWCAIPASPRSPSPAASPTGRHISEICGGMLQALLARAGRQERDRGHGRRRRRARRRRRPLGGVRDQRPALHRVLAADRPPAPARRLHRRAGRPRLARSASATASTSTSTSAR